MADHGPIDSILTEPNDHGPWVAVLMGYCIWASNAATRAVVKSLGNSKISNFLCLHMPMVTKLTEPKLYSNRVHLLKAHVFRK